MMTISQRTKVLVLASMTLLLLFSLSLIAKNNLGTANFWFDESGQFWTSYGVASDAAPFTAKGDFSEVWQRNSYANLDPPSFTFLLRAWLSLSTDPFFLRLLPFTFFFFTLLLLGRCIFFLTQNIYLCLSLGFFPLALPHLLNWSIVLRSYSLWSLAFVWLLYQAFIFVSSTRPYSAQEKIITGLSLGLGLLTRYPIMIAYASVLLATLLTVRPKKINQPAPFLMSFLPFTVLLFFFLSAHFLNHDVSLTPQYTHSLHLSRLPLNELISTLITHFSDWPFLLCLIYLILFACFSQRLPSGPKKKIHSFLFYFILIHHLQLLLFSFLQLHPWSMRERFNLDLTYLALIAAAASLSVIYTLLPKLQGPSAKILSAILILIIFQHSKSYRYQAYSQAAEQIAAYFQTAPSAPLYVDNFLTPEVRFLFEHGHLKNHPELYPKRIIFLSDHPQDLRALAPATFLISKHSLKTFQQYLLIQHPLSDTFLGTL